MTRSDAVRAAQDRADRTDQTYRVLQSTTNPSDFYLIRSDLKDPDDAEHFTTVYPRTTNAPKRTAQSVRNDRPSQAKLF